MSRRLLIGASVAVVGILFAAFFAFRSQPTETRTAADEVSVPLKQAVVALFSVKPGDPPPELPAIPAQDMHDLPRLISALTPADGCDPKAVRREYQLFMESGGFHLEFLEAYRKKLTHLHTSGHF